MARDYSLLGDCLRVRGSALTIADLEAQARAVLVDPRTDVIPCELPLGMGSITFDGPRRVIRIDPYACIQPTLIHEIVHHSRRRELAAWGQMEEPVVMVAEDLLNRYINRSQRRRQWWRETWSAKVPHLDPQGDE
jgi:hypothetical protein